MTTEATTVWTLYRPDATSHVVFSIAPQFAEKRIRIKPFFLGEHSYMLCVLTDDGDVLDILNTTLPRDEAVTLWEKLVRSGWSTENSL